MRVLVTGSGGFVGKKVYDHLTATGKYTVYGMVHKKDCVDETHFLCELSDMSSVEELPETDVIVHVAAVIVFTGGRFEDYFRSNCIGTYNLVKWAEKTGVRKIIYIGAVSSYGQVSDVLSPYSKRIESDMITKDYGLSKMVSDRLVEQSPVDSFTVVLPGVLGEDSHDCWLVRLAADIAENNKVKCYNPENRFNNSVTAGQVAEFIELLIDREVLGNKTVILGASNCMTIRQICEYLKEKLSSSSEVDYIDRKGTGFIIDTSPAIEAGFKPLTMEELLDVAAEVVTQGRFTRFIS